MLQLGVAAHVKVADEIIFLCQVPRLLSVERFLWLFRHVTVIAIPPL